MSMEKQERPALIAVLGKDAKFSKRNAYNSSTVAASRGLKAEQLFHQEKVT